MSGTKNIYQRVNEVRKSLGYLQKDATIRDGGGYKAITHDKVTDAARGFMIQEGVVIVMRQTAGRLVETGSVTGKGNPWMRYEAMYEFDFVNADEPADKFTVVVEAHAMDTGDKAPGKTASYAKKTAMLKTLELVTGEDDEQTHADRRPVGPTPEEASKIADFLAAIETADTRDALEELGTAIAKAPKIVKDAVRSAYSAKYKTVN